MKRGFSFLSLCLAMAVIVPSLFAQANNAYQQTNLVSDQPGVAAHTDSNLVNAWGMSFFPNDAFWISNNGSGTTTIYDGTGTTALPVVTIPPPRNSTATSTPTGQVANTVNDFPVSGVNPFFIFDTEDGTISAWTGGANAVLMVDNSAAGAVYKGLTIATNATGNFLLAANFRAGTIDVFDKHYAPATLAGNFTDPNLPAGYAPFNVQAMGTNRIVVTYALQDAAKHDDVAGAGNGYVSMFDTDGHFVNRIASQGTLNSPWGVAIAPNSFGAFAGQLLIGNFGDGRINGFDGTGNLIGQLNDQNGQPLSIDGLWAIAFGGGGGSGDPSKLYFTAGPASESHGLFGSLSVVSTTTSGGDFTLGAPQTLTVVRGGSANLQIDVTGTGGFTGQVNLSCSGLPSGTSCNFSQPSIQAGGTQAQTMLTVSVGSTYVAPPYGVARVHNSRAGRMLAMLTTFGMGGFGCVLFGARRRRAKLMGLLALGLLAMVVMAQTACGGGSKSSGNTTGTGTNNSFTMSVTGTSGSLTHSTAVTVTVQ